MYDLTSSMLTSRRRDLQPTAQPGHKKSLRGSLDGSIERGSVSVMLLLSNPTDCDLFSARLADCRFTDLVEACDDLDAGLKRAGELRPRVLIFDPKISPLSLNLVLGKTQQGEIENLLVLDHHVREGLLMRLLGTPRTSYVTRKAGYSTILSAVRKIAEQSRRVFDPTIEQRVIRTAHGLRLRKRSEAGSIASLTPREIEVLIAVAEGRSVRDCAKILQIAESTIDNHKSRLMKKLNLHKNSQLTHLAIREGLIFV